MRFKPHEHLNKSNHQRVSLRNIRITKAQWLMPQAIHFTGGNDSKPPPRCLVYGKKSKSCYECYP
ncbi:hypothetical protein HYC85_004073 [Camellia sinensis]|uniref:Uncharacterized protein n=1 Tax=Camellia sinensis TaxID=4442 RepID=A0A7J7HY48_CAMSI|nr:hypothetical protein HYC85_004073 [Camellia sinensis]